MFQRRRKEEEVLFACCILTGWDKLSSIISWISKKMCVPSHEKNLEKNKKMMLAKTHNNRTNIQLIRGLVQRLGHFDTLICFYFISEPYLSYRRIIKSNHLNIINVFLIRDIGAVKQKGWVVFECLILNASVQLKSFILLL